MDDTEHDVTVPSSVRSGADIATEAVMMVCSILVLCFAVGIGVGYYFGESPATTALHFLSIFFENNSSSRSSIVFIHAYCCFYSCVQSSLAGGVVSCPFVHECA